MTSLPTTTSDEKPAFGIVVYVSRTDSGATQARVANMDGVEATGTSERDVLPQVVSKCRELIQEALASGMEPPMVNPPAPKRPDEQRRFLPMHL